jgi:glucan phosphoethanolaminetransferase (alkaline phosphatase superfamily)
MKLIKKDLKRVHTYAGVALAVAAFGLLQITRMVYAEIVARHAVPFLLFCAASAISLGLVYLIVTQVQEMRSEECTTYGNMNDSHKIKKELFWYLLGSITVMVAGSICYWFR